MADKKDRKRGLGRGLSALMADVTEAEQAPATLGAAVGEKLIPIEQIEPNPDQPRKRFEKEDLEDLAASISEKGVIQPLIVRQSGDTYEIVAGERRWRAAQMAKLHELPVIVRDFTDVEVLEIAIIENIQRADLNAVEEAMGFRQLMDRFGHTQEQLASALGKSRSHIANLLRLLNLPEPVLEMLRRGELSAGHARALIPADDPVALAKQIVKGGLSVRAAEALVKKEAKGESTQASASTSGGETEKDADTKALEGDLSANLGMKVQLDHKPGQEAGVMTVKYASLDDLDRLCRLLSGG